MCFTAQRAVPVDPRMIKIQLAPLVGRSNAQKIKLINSVPKETSQLDPRFLENSQKPARDFLSVFKLVTVLSHMKSDPNRSARGQFFDSNASPAHMQCSDFDKNLHRASSYIFLGQKKTYIFFFNILSVREVLKVKND